jgi:hypothetical protein
MPKRSSPTATVRAMSADDWPAVASIYVAASARGIGIGT